MNNPMISQLIFNIITSMYNPILLGGLEHLDYVSIIYGNVIIPTDELHHFSEG